MSPFLTCLDFGVCNAIRLVRFGYNTFTGCVALRVAPTPPFPLKREPTASAPRGDTLSTRIDCYRSLLMPLVRERKESKLVRSLVLYVKLGVRLLAAVAARVPSFKLHIPFIRTS